MTEHGQSAVLVMAAGAGTRMRSDTPKVLHTLGGRSMLSHVLHSVTKVAPQHLVVVLGHERERITPAVTELAEALGRTIDIAVQEQQRGTGHAVACGLTALPADFTGTVVVTSGDVPLMDAETLADLSAAHAADRQGVAVDRHAQRLDGRRVRVGHHDRETGLAIDRATGDVDLAALLDAGH